MKQKLELFFYVIIGVISTIILLSVLTSCAISIDSGESYTRLYPITSYSIESDRITATYIIEDGSEGYINTPTTNIYFHDGEDTLIVISSDEYGTDFDGVKDFYLYLNSEKTKESLGTMIDSMVENGG